MNIITDIMNFYIFRINSSQFQNQIRQMLV